MKLDNKVREIIQANLVLSASSDENVAYAYQRKIAKALELPLKDEVKEGLLVEEIFERMDVPNYLGSSIPFPTALFNFQDGVNYKAFAVPKCGFVPYNTLEGDEVRVPFYEIANGLDTCLEYIEQGRWDVVADIYAGIRAGFYQKMNDDGFHAILSAADSRDIVVQDSAATAGVFTKKLISDLGIRMIREGGGNTGSVNRFQLTDMFVSPEALGQMYNWDEAELDPVTRREMNSKSMYDGVMLFNIRIRPLEEFGVAKEYQTYITGTLGRALTGGDTEYVLGMDLSKRNRGLVMPVKKDLELFEDQNLHRANKWGIYGRMNLGFAQLDPRLSMLASF